MKHVKRKCGKLQQKKKEVEREVCIGRKIQSCFWLTLESCLMIFKFGFFNGLISQHNTFDFKLDKIIFKHTSKLELNFLKAFHIYKNHTSIVNCDFASPPLIRLLEISCENLLFLISTNVFPYCPFFSLCNLLLAIFPVISCNSIDQ